MTIDAAKQRLVDVATSQFDYLEGRNNWNKYAEDTRIEKLYGWKPQNQPWCFTENTLVLTTEGYKPIQDINVGDYVLNAHGDRFNRVTDIHVHDDDVCDYRVYGAVPFSVTLDHPFLAEKRNSKWSRAKGFKEWGFHKISDLNRGDMIAAPKTPVLYEDILSYDEAWIIGYYVGDGYPSKGHEYILCANESKAEKINEHATGRWDKDYKSRTCKQFNFSVYGKPVLKTVLDDCGHGAANKRVPKQILFGSNEAKRAFLDGYLSADGCENNHSFNSVSMELITGIARIYFDLGQACSVNVYTKAPQAQIWDKRLNAYRTINQHERVYACRISCTEYARHRDYIQKDKYVMLPLREIGNVHQDTVYNLTTDGDHTYTANNLAVHNCCTFVNWCFLEAFGYDVGSRLTYGGTAACANSAELFRQHGAFVKFPAIGDQAFFYSGGWINHTGIVIKVEGTQFTTMEGNYSDKVAEVTHNIGQRNVAGFGRPCWEIVSGLQEPTKPEPAEEHPKELPPLVLPDLKYGAVGDAVSLLQAALNLRGYNAGRVDGEYGPMTDAAVNRFKRDAGINDSTPLWDKLLERT